MILQKNRKQVIAIKQEDHAAFAAFLLENWSDHGFPHDPDREQIIFATKVHDNGWKEYDANPRLDQRTQLPIDFMHVNAEETYEVWMRGSKKYVEKDPLVALLITHHAYALHEHAHRRDGVWKKFFIELAQQRATLRDQLGLVHNQVERIYSFLRMADWFSLSYCLDPKLGAEKPAKYAGYSVRRDGSTFQFRPYPFHSRELHYKLPFYPLDKTGYASQAKIQAALKKPSYEEIHILPLERFE